MWLNTRRPLKNEQDAYVLIWNALKISCIMKYQGENKASIRLTFVVWEKEDNILQHGEGRVESMDTIKTFFMLLKCLSRWYFFFIRDSIEGEPDTHSHTAGKGCLQKSKSRPDLHYSIQSSTPPHFRILLNQIFGSSSLSTSFHDKWMVRKI